MRELILVLDFGGQYKAYCPNGERIKVYSEIHPVYERIKSRS